MRCCLHPSTYDNTFDFLQKYCILSDFAYYFKCSQNTAKIQSVVGVLTLHLPFLIFPYLFSIYPLLSFHILHVFTHLQFWLHFSLYLKIFAFCSSFPLAIEHYFNNTLCNDVAFFLSLFLSIKSWVLFGERAIISTILMVTNDEKRWGIERGIEWDSHGTHCRFAREATS